MLRIEKLPQIESHVRWMQELEKCKSLADINFEIRRDNPEIHQLISKLYDERKFWGRSNQVKHRTLKINAYGRNDYLKNWLFEAIL